MTDFAIDIITAAERATPSAVAGIVKVYTKDVAGVTHAFALMSNGTETQLTPPTFSAGSISYAKLGQLITTGPATLSTATAAQPIFASGRNTITLALGVYQLRCVYNFISTNTTSMTPSIAFGGTHVSTMGYHVAGLNAGGFVSAMYFTHGQTQAAVAISGNQTLQQCILRLEGIFTVTTAGTFIP